MGAREVAISELLQHWPTDCRSIQVDELGSAGGFSGAAIWKVHAPRGDLCLRRWPREHPTPERLEWLQSVLWFVAARGFHLAPTAIATLEQTGFVRAGGHLWELTNWLPGVADYHDHPNEHRLHAAMEALAQFHLAAEEFPLDGDGHGPSPGLQQRLTQLDDFLAGGFERLRSHLNPRAWPDLFRRAVAILDDVERAAPPVRDELHLATHLTVPLQPCIRDIWHDHILLEGDRVTGIVDFGAMRVDSVACDVARLLGSLVGDDPVGWLNGLMAYRHTRPLSDVETRLLTTFDRSSVLLSPVSWLVWVFEEGRQFDDPQTVLERMDLHHDRLRVLLIEAREGGW